MLCEKHNLSRRAGPDMLPTECVVCLQEEVIRLKHVVAVLKGQIAMAHHVMSNIEGNTRVRDGKLEVWCLGDWVDVEKANAEFPDIGEDEE